MRRLFLGVCCWLGGTACLSAAIQVPPGGSDLAAGSELKAHADPSHAHASRIEGGGWKIEVSKPDVSRAFLAQVTLDCPAGALTPGETVLALIKARATKGTASIEAKLQLAGPPYTAAAATTTVEVGTELLDLPVIFW